MDDTNRGSLNPDPSTNAAQRRPKPRALVLTGTAIAVTGLFAVAACGTTGSADGGASGDSAFSGVAPSGNSIVQDGSMPAGSAPVAGDPAGQRDYSQFSVSRGSGSGLKLTAADFGRSQIKTAQLGLRSKTITIVMDQIQGVATGQGGFVASENTVTDIHGRATSSSISIRVPVDNFDATIDQVLKLGQVASRRISTQDVTGRVADVASRVTSARDSLAQLRVLFSHATKLSDIITLESELSEREADLESLLAQQRALTGATTLSTISIQVSRPPTPETTTVTSQDDESNGFVGGLKQGWNALADTFVAVSHGLGAALPLGLTIFALLALLWAAVRRLPKRHVELSE